MVVRDVVKKKGAQLAIERMGLRRVSGGKQHRKGKEEAWSQERPAEAGSQIMQRQLEGGELKRSRVGRVLGRRFIGLPSMPPCMLSSLLIGYALRRKGLNASGIAMKDKSTGTFFIDWHIASTQECCDIVVDKYQF